MTPVSIAFRWAMLCTKSKLRFRQYSFNHRTRNLRSVEILRLTPYPLYQHAIVPFEFPRQVGWLFPLFTFNNVPLRGRYTFALSSARFSAYYPHKVLLLDCGFCRRVRPVRLPSVFVFQTALAGYWSVCRLQGQEQAVSAYLPSECRRIALPITQSK